MRCTPILVLVLALAVPCPPLDAQEDAHTLFERGLVLERATGDVVGAVALYERLVREHPDERELAARALLQLAAAYEKLDHPGAADAYRRVLEEYPDRGEARGRAAAALVDLETPAADGTRRLVEPTYTLLLDELPARPPEAPAGHDVSPDGRHIVYAGRLGGNPAAPALLLSDRSGTVVRPLVRGSADGLRRFTAPRWSPDGRRILFGALEGDDGSMAALYVVSAEGGEPRRVTRPGTATGVWSADGRAITYRVRDGEELRTASLDDPAQDVRIQAPALTYTARVGGYSPDGRWLALDLPEDERRERDIWLVPAGGGRAIQVTHAPGPDSHPAWGPDGRLYFVSERSGSSNLWRLAIDAATGLPRGEPERLTSYEDAVLRHPRVTRDGGVTYVLSRTRSVVRVGPAERPDQAAHLVRGNHPQIAPDGRTVVFQGEGPGQEGLFAVPVGGGTPRRLTNTPPLGGMTSWQLSPDGRDVAFVADAEGGRGIFRVSTDGGRPVRVADVAADEGPIPVWSPDGSRIAFTRGSGLYSVAREGGHPTRLASVWKWDPWTLRWSPDGRHLAALGWGAPPDQRDGHQNDVFVVPASGGEARRICGEDEHEYKEFLDWRPDGRAVTYMFYDGEEPPPGGDLADGLRIAYVDGRPTERFIDRSETWDYWGKWSPDGRSFVFAGSGNDGSGWSSFRKDLKTGDVTLFSRGDGSLPTWSRDGRTAAWHVSDTSTQLWMVEPGR